ncbi:MAG: GntR family transcriptional regulator [Gemmatimonadaceae bacterium]
MNIVRVYYDTNPPRDSDHNDALVILIDPASGVPVYRQLMDQIRFQVTSGILHPGSELPSTRKLSEDLGVNPMTVSKAYGLLEQEGILDRRAGLPLIVARRPVGLGAQQRLAQLRAMLQPPALAARQLGVSAASAGGLFRRMVESATRKSEPSK